MKEFTIGKRVLTGRTIAQCAYHLANSERRKARRGLKALPALVFLADCRPNVPTDNVPALPDATLEDCAVFNRANDAVSHHIAIGPLVGCACENYHSDAELLDIFERVLLMHSDFGKFERFAHIPALEFSNRIENRCKEAQNVFLVEWRDILNEWLCQALEPHNPTNDSALLAQYRRENRYVNNVKRGNVKNDARRSFVESSRRLKRIQNHFDDIYIVHGLRKIPTESEGIPSVFRIAANLSRRARLGKRTRVAQKTTSGKREYLKTLGYSGELLRETARATKETVDKATMIEREAPRDDDSPHVMRLDVTANFTAALQGTEKILASGLMQGMSIPEISSTSGIPVQTLRDAMKRVKTALASRLSSVVE